MTDKYLTWIRATIIGIVLLLPIVLVCSEWLTGLLNPILLATTMILFVVFGLLTFKATAKWQARFVAIADAEFEAEVRWLDGLPPARTLLVIVAAAALSLMLELAVIRWQGTVFEFFAFYRNFGLLACFAGLGCGYALAGKSRLPLFLCVPLIALQQLAFSALRYGAPEPWLRSLVAMPVGEQSNVGMSSDISMAEYVAIYYFLTVALSLTMVAFVPVGQLCGRLMDKTNTLSAYGANLLGSLIGILLMMGLSALRTPPAVWFGLSFAGIVLFTAHNRRALVCGMSALLFGVTVLCWPVTFGFERVYSPYQLLERGPGFNGWSELRAAGLYYQRALDLSPASAARWPLLQLSANYYNLPYSMKGSNAGDVVVFGSGMGNDLAAALRNGAQHVDAIEIDPCILAFGKAYHPEKPYDDPRVTCVNDDARAYLRRSKKQYDMVVFGLLDSHTISSHASSVRIDSYVYTLQSFKEARSHLKDGGVLSLSFSMPSPRMIKKVYKMMTEAFDGHPPIMLNGRYDLSFTFVQNKEGTLTTVPQALFDKGFRNFADELAKVQGHVDVATDDWPFFYMPVRTWPLSYLPMVALLVGLTVLLYRTLSPDSAATALQTRTEEKWWHLLDFFFMGASFMLVEAKAITELSLNFGSTWVVTGVVLTAIMLMAFCANVIVSKIKITQPTVPYMLLLGTLLAGYFVALGGGFQATFEGKLASIAILTVPIAFSGIVFSTLIVRAKSIQSAMAANLIGAMLGGFLEYGAMYLGYGALYLVAVALYGAAFVVSFLKFRNPAQHIALEPATVVERNSP